MKISYLFFINLILTSCFGYNHIEEIDIYERYGSNVVSARNHKNYFALYVIGGIEYLDTNNYAMSIIMQPQDVNFNENWLIAKNHRNKYMILDLNNVKPLWVYPKRYRKFHKTFKDLDIPDSLFIRNSRDTVPDGRQESE